MERGRYAAATFFSQRGSEDWVGQSDIESACHPHMPDKSRFDARPLRSCRWSAKKRRPASQQGRFQPRFVKRPLSIDRFDPETAIHGQFVASQLRQLVHPSDAKRRLERHRHHRLHFGSGESPPRRARRPLAVEVTGSRLPIRQPRSLRSLRPSYFIGIATIVTVHRLQPPPVGDRNTFALHNREKHRLTGQNIEACPIRLPIRDHHHIAFR